MAIRKDRKVPKEGKIVEKIVYVSLFFAFLGALFVSLSSLFGLLTNFPWLSENIPKFTLLLLALSIPYVFHLIHDFKKIEEATKDLVEEMNKMRGGVEVLNFENQAQLYKYVVTKLQKAEKSVDDISWGSKKTLGLKTKAVKKAYYSYLNTVKQVCAKKNIYYREVSRIADEHYLSRVEPLIQDVNKYYSYNLRYYDIPENFVPLMSYIIFDSEEVLLGFFRGNSLSPEREVYLSIRQPDIVRVFKSYFETLWNGTDKVIKEGGTIDEDLLDQIKRKIGGG